MGTALIVAVIALILGISAIGYAAYLQSQVGSAQSAASSIPKINQPVKTWNITMEWTNTVSSGQDRFNPQFLTIAQGDTVRITFLSNDTADGHTFTIQLPTGIFQLNDSLPGQEKEIKDDTHFNPYGAYELAKCIIMGVRAEVPALAQYVVPDFKSFDPAHPDPVVAWQWPASPARVSAKPDGS